MPLGSFGNAKGQENQVPDQFEIFHGSGGKDDSLDNLYLEITPTRNSFQRRTSMNS